MLLGVFFFIQVINLVYSERKNKHQIERRELETSITVLAICVMDLVSAI